jgi:uncharacterized protein (TIGR03437 family)
MSGKKTFIARWASTKRLTFLFIVLAVCLAFSWLQQSSAARQSSSRVSAGGSPLSPRVLASRAGQSSNATMRQRPAPRENFDLRVGHQRSLVAPPETTGAGATPHSSTQPQTGQTGQTGQTSRLKSARPSVRIRWSSLTGAPSRIYGHAEALSEPSSADAGSVARGFLKANDDLFRLSGAEVDGLKEGRRYRTVHNGVTHLTLQQQIGGIEVFQSAMTIHLNREGAVIAAGGELLPGAAQAVNLTQPKITSVEALRSAAEHAGAEVKEQPEQRLLPGSADAHQEFARGQSFGQDVKARLVYFPLAADRVRLAWEFVVWMRETPDAYLILIDAEQKTLIFRHNLTNYEENPLRPHGLVYTEDSPRPDSPHTGDSPPIVERQDLPFRASPFNGAELFKRSDPHYDWWAGNQATGLISNNADVHLDRDPVPDQPDLPRLASPIGNFSFPVDFTVEPTTEVNQKAAQVNLFYWINRYHDILYSFGFDEAAGNFQANNFGFGGLGNDAVIGDAQDGGFLNNANFTTPPDGQPGRVQMFLWNTTTPQLDGSFDQSVIAHELTHGLSNRLVGNAIGLFARQSGGMGEGWSDYFALTLLQSESDPLDGAYPIGQYVINNYAYGIRFYPYSTNMEINPRTFGDLPLLAPLVHGIGEIWCSMLWEMRTLLIKQYGFREGQRQSIQLVVDGLKLTPLAPTFLDARDAILLADRINNNGANQCLIGKAFAKRGLGVSASSQDADNPYDVVEAFDEAPSCSSAAWLSLDKSSYVDNEIVRITLSDRSAPAPVKVNVASSRTGDRETIILKPDPSVSGSFKGAIRLDEGRSRPGDGKLQGSAEAGDLIEVVYLDNTTEGGGSDRITATAACARESVILEDDVERGNQFWLPNGTWAITNELYGTPTHSWKVTNQNVDPIFLEQLALTSPALDLTGLNEVVLSFSQNLRLFSTAGFHYGWVEISIDDGATWRFVDSFTGMQDEFTPSRLRLQGLDGQPRARLRFRLTANSFTALAGVPVSWAIDDIRLTARSADPRIIPPGDVPAPVITSINPAFGPPIGGTLVTISGANFTESEDTRVTFDGIPAAQVTVLSSTTLTAVTPRHIPGPINVRVVNRRGSAAQRNGFTYYEPGSDAGKPSLASLSPTAGSISGGTLVTLTGANFTPETAVSFGSKAALVTFINSTMLRAVTPAASATGVVDVTVRNGNRQASLSRAFSYQAATPPVVQVLNPQGGENLYTGSAVTIRWQSSDNREVTKHRIVLSHQPFPEVLVDIATEVNGDARSFTWRLPSAMQPTTQARIRVTAIDDEGAETEAVSGEFAILQRWEQKALMPGLNQGASFAADGRYLYAIGNAYTETGLQPVMQRFDPIANTWTSEGLPPAPVNLGYGEAVFLAGKIYIPGGNNFPTFELSRIHLAYDIATNTWATQAEAPAAATYYALAVDETRGVYYYTGGVEADSIISEDFVISTAVRMYDPNTNTWADLPPMNNARYQHEAAVIDGKLYVAGGYGPTGELLSGEVYDFETRQWSSIAPLNRSRVSAASAVAKDAAGNPFWLLVGFEGSAFQLDAEVYDVRNNRWIQLDNSFNLPSIVRQPGNLPDLRSLEGGSKLGGDFYVVSAAGGLGFRTERLSIDPLELAIDNQPPVLTVPDKQVGKANTEIKFTVSASDFGSFAPIAITADGLPPSANFETVAISNNRTVGTFSWTPTAADTGRSFNVSFTASDGELSDAKQVTIQVVEAAPLTLAQAGNGRSGQLAADSIATVLGANLATDTKVAQTSRLPFAIAGTTVTINGTPAPIFSVSPDRVSFLVPATIEPGSATIVVHNPTGRYSIGSVQIVDASPVIFTPTVDGSGEASLLSMGNGAELHLPQFKTPANRPPNILTLYGTGIRRARAAIPRDKNGVAESINVTLGGQPARVLYAGAEGRLSGLDRIIVEIPADLPGTERVEAVISIDGVTVNRAMISLR